MASDETTPATEGGTGKDRREILQWVPRLGLIVGALGISLMVVLIIAEIISTKFFNYSLPYVLEYSEYLIPIIAFWGAAFTLREEGHVRADIFLHRMPEKVQEWFVLLGYLLGLCFLIVVFKHSLDVALLSIKMKRMSFYSTPSPLGWPQLAVAVGLALFALQLLIEIAYKARRLFLRYRPEAQR